MGLITKQILNSSSVSTHPFQIFTSTTEAGQNSVQINPGTVNNILPNNIINNNTLRQFTYSTSINYIILECRTNGKFINSATIKIQPAVPIVQTPVALGLPSSVEILIGGVSESTIYQIVKSNLSLSVSLAYVLNNTSNSSLPFIPYYIWSNQTEIYSVFIS